MPQKQTSQEYRRFQTQDDKVVEDHKSDGKAIPNSTFLDSAASLILPPLPSMKYIVDPSTRENVIIHDKVYYEKDLPERDLDVELDSFEWLEEEIAREYHKNMGWRKVVVKIKPDAHNNIIVRRRFANAYGWPVIQHLVENHFGPNRTVDSKMIDSAIVDLVSTNSLDEENGLTRIISRDLISRQNKEIDDNVSEEQRPEEYPHEWINSEHNGDSVFAVGVTGLLGEVADMVGGFRDQITKYSLNPPSLPIIGEIPFPAALMAPTDTNNGNTKSEEELNKDLKLSNGIMNDFI